MTQTAPMAPAFPAPPTHVPTELVQLFELGADPGMRRCPFSTVTALRDRGRAFWNPANQQFGGTWILTAAEDIRFVMTRPDLFSNKGEAGFSQLVGENWDLIPLELDPPEHTGFRQLLNPLLSPPAIKGMTPGIVARAVELIEAVSGRGECEFMEAFGRPFPVGIFLQLMGLPPEQTDTFLKWEFDLLHDPDMGTKVTAALAIREYLRRLAAERRAQPRDDLTSFVVAAEIGGRKLTDDEVMGTLYLLFVGGLDTVASSLGFFFQHLAEHPEHQARLRANPSEIDRAVEELLRRYSVVTVNRQCKVDIDLAGVRMKAGDWMAITTSLASLDPAEFDRPFEVDFDRRNNRHLGFSFGPHFCLGSHLARRELSVALREWLARIPPFRVKPGSTVEVRGGGVFGVDHLELAWNPA